MCTTAHQGGERHQSQVWSHLKQALVYKAWHALVQGQTPTSVNLSCKYDSSVSHC